MKYLLTLLITFTILSCGSDDETNTSGGVENSFVITVDETTPNSATITWTVPTGTTAGATIKYQVFLNGTELANNYSARSYTFNNLQFESNYAVAVYALDNAGNSTFAETNFTTLRNPVGGHIVLSNQAAIENFDYEEVWSLTLVGAGVTDISNLSILKRVGDITISATSLTSLNGLENVLNPNPPDFSFYPSLNIRNNPQLENINALGTYSGGVRKLIITNNPVLNNLSGLEINDFMRELTLKDFPATSFENFGTLQHCNKITLENISSNVLTGFNSLALVPDKFEMTNIDFQNLDGLANLNNVNILEVTNSFNIDNLNGIGDSSFPFNYILTGPLPPLNFEFLNDVLYPNVTILNTNISDLNAFSNVSNLLRLHISDNANLTNISALTGLTSIYDLVIKNNQNLTSLSGLDNIATINYLSISGIPSLTNLNGLGSLQQINTLSISNCSQFVSLEGTDLVASSNASETGVYINNNPLLSDFCAIQPYLQAGGIPYVDMGWNGGAYSYGVTGNLYNPSVGQITTPNGCSL